MRDMGPILEEIRQLKDDRDSWRRVAERLENEKLNALSRIQIAEQALNNIVENIGNEEGREAKIIALKALEQIQKE